MVLWLNDHWPWLTPFVALLTAIIGYLARKRSSISLSWLRRWRGFIRCVEKVADLENKLAQRDRTILELEESVKRTERQRDQAHLYLDRLIESASREILEEPLRIRFQQMMSLGMKD